MKLILNWKIHGFLDDNNGSENEDYGKVFGTIYGKFNNLKIQGYINNQFHTEPFEPYQRKRVNAGLV